MALTGFIVIMTETLPAGLLPQFSSDFGVSEGGAGQLVSAYALGTVVAAIPAIALTQHVSRKKLLVAGLLGFLVANGATALAPGLTVALVARFVGGAFSGLLWGMLAGYARRIVAPAQAGRALAIAMTGAPVALSIGTPVGSWLGSVTGWRWAFACVSALTLVVAAAVVIVVPDVAGIRATSRPRLTRVAALPGVAAVLVVVFVWMLAHNLLYTYVAPFLTSAHLGLRPDVALFVFGVAALGGIFATGVLIDRALRALTLGSIAMFAFVALALTLAPGSLLVTVCAIVGWGFAFGGAATLLQTAIANAAGEAADVANAMLTTVFNLAIFAAGAAGALLVDGAGAQTVSAAMGILSAIAFLIAALARTHAFPKPAR
ncbi:MFS transporter [Amycolatopsis sp. GM8]|uniref:MFS transporter n=1 Tax=Amycolatopsis sp. GM8 TaxID=2896530 RepID=UPI0021031DA3|nr:MFS transporter [Amycolatopsis sp. GM8]